MIPGLDVSQICSNIHSVLLNKFANTSDVLWGQQCSDIKRHWALPVGSSVVVSFDVKKPHTIFFLIQNDIFNATFSTFDFYFAHIFRNMCSTV